MVDKGAIISPCQRYRYFLWRTWDETKNVLVYCMLNPSTADENIDDPTIKRCVERAKRMGFGSIHVVNLFAFRATDPRELYTAADPVGPDNDQWIKDVGQHQYVKGKLVRRDDSMFLCGWGSHGGLRGRDKEVLDLLKLTRIWPYALKMTRGGQPSHPLYIGYNIYPHRIGETP